LLFQCCHGPASSGVLLTAANARCALYMHRSYTDPKRLFHPIHVKIILTIRLSELGIFSTEHRKIDFRQFLLAPTQHRRLRATTLLLCGFRHDHILGNSVHHNRHHDVDAPLLRHFVEQVQEASVMVAAAVELESRTNCLTEVRSSGASSKRGRSSKSAPARERSHDS
jgi:hypothetical protein